MVEAAGRSAAAGEEASKKKSSSSCTGAAAMAEKLRSKQAPAEKEKGGKKQSSQCREEPAGSPSGYRSALIKSIFSCRSSRQRPEGDNRRPPGSKKLVGCSAAPSICKQLRDSDSSQGQGQRVPAAGQPCKRRASVSERRASKKKPQLSEVPAAAAVSKQTTQTQLQRGGSSSSSSGGGSSFRTGVQLRRLSGCYECHMVVDPGSGSGSGSSSMRAATAAVCPCPDCGEIFARQESLHFHQSIRHAVSELGADDTSRNIIEIIFQSSWLKKQSPVCKVERILKVHNTPRTLARFEEYRDAVKAKAAAAAAAAQQQQQQQAAKAGSGTSKYNKHPRCTADGNELLRFHCATLACELGLNGATHLCSGSGGGGGGGCGACAIIRDGFKTSSNAGVRTTATSGRAHDDAVSPPDQDEEEERSRCRAMLVCRVIAGRVKRLAQLVGEDDAAEEEPFDSVAASSSSAGVYSNLEELQVFNPRAILPCFVVVYKAV